ncbi:MAG TPA: hypothetical protein VL175_15885 [Pirellulales bacterium]|jgi:hypothetical protein|nr:hypothetical protein [Pirellulales bacterium]
MHRPTIGVIAIVLLAAGLLLRDPSQATLSAACLRVGMVMGLLWLAHPQLERLPLWATVVGGVLALAILRWPKLVVFVLPLALVLWLLKPRASRTDLP